VLGITLLMFAVLFLGGGNSLFQRYNHYVAHFPQVFGLMKGAKVQFHGLKIGSVEEIRFDESRNKISVKLKVLRQHRSMLRESTLASIQTQGVLGDKFVTLHTGAFDKPEIPNHGEIKTESEGGIEKFLDNGQALLTSLNRIATGMETLLDAFTKNNRHDSFFQHITETSVHLAKLTAKIDTQFKGIKLNDSVAQLNEILKKINRGEGTLGALINDPVLYDDAKRLMGGVNRNRIMRNLVRQAVKDSEQRAINGK